MYITPTTRVTTQNMVAIQGSFNLSAAAAVVANTTAGDCISAVTKTGVGTYLVRCPAQHLGGIRVVQVVNATCGYTGTAPATAILARVVSCVNEATTGDVLITLNTSTAAWAAADTTAATTLNFEVQFKCRPKV